jgi:hypothetical protein
MDLRKFSAPQAARQPRKGTCCIQECRPEIFVIGSMLVAVALANKMARIVWALLAKGGIYRASIVAAYRPGRRLSKV